jgi:hypothetical protein
MREPRIPPFEPFSQSARKMEPPRPVRSRGLSVVAGLDLQNATRSRKSYGLTLFLSYLPLPLPFFERRTRFVIRSGNTQDAVAPHGTEMAGTPARFAGVVLVSPPPSDPRERYRL